MATGEEVKKRSVEIMDVACNSEIEVESDFDLDADEGDSDDDSRVREEGGFDISQSVYELRLARGRNSDDDNELAFGSPIKEEESEEEEVRRVLERHRVVMDTVPVTPNVPLLLTICREDAAQESYYERETEGRLFGQPLSPVAGRFPIKDGQYLFGDFERTNLHKFSQTVSDPYRERIPQRPRRSHR